MCAPNGHKPASTRTSWANKAQEIAVGIARLVEVVCKSRQLSVLRSGPASLGTRPAHRPSRRPPQLAASFISGQACDVAYCEGFRMTAHRDDSACTGAGGRKPPVKEPAGDEWLAGARGGGVGSGR